MPATLPANANQPAASAPSTAQIQQTQAAPSTPDANESVKVASLQTQLEQIVKQNEAAGITTSVSVESLKNARDLYEHNNATPQFAASVNKLPIALLLLEDLRSGKANLNTQLTWTSNDVRAGNGKFDQPGAPTTGTLRDVLFDMLNYSGNTAVRVIVNYSLDGPQAVNDRLALYPELQVTRLQVLTPTTFYLGNTTSKESLWTIQKLLSTSDQYEEFIKNALVTNIYSYYGVRSQLQNPDLIVLANKVGILDDPDGNNRHDVGIIYNTKNGKAIAYSFMTTTAYGNTAATFQAEHSLDLLGRQVLGYAGDKASNKPPKANANARNVIPERRVQY